MRPPRPAAASPERRALSDSEVKQLLKAVAGTRLDVPIRISLATGIREGELLGLRWRDLDPQRKTINIHRSLSRVGVGEFNQPKAHSRRTLELSDVTLAILREHRADQNEQRLRLGEVWEDSDLIFGSTFGTPWGARNLLRAYRVALSRTAVVNVHEVTWHTLRHTAASHWIGAGVPSFEVARRLGHSSTSITERTYSHLLPGGQQRSAHVMDALIG